MKSFLRKKIKTILSTIKSISLIKISYDIKNIRLYQEELETIIKKDKPDIIYLHEFKALWTLNRIFKNNKDLFKDIKLIYDAHEIECFRNPPKLLIIRLVIEYIEIKFLKQTKSSVISVSHGICEYYKTKLKNNKKVFLIQNLPSKVSFYKDDYDIINNKSVRRFFFKNSIIPHNSKLGVYVGNLTINRGIEEAIELVNNFPNIYLALVGSCNNEVFKRKIDKLNFDKSRIKIINPVENHLVVNFIKSADFSIIPTLPITLSYYYSSPNKLHESKAAKLPIFAQNLPENHLELKINSNYPIGTISDFFNMINLKSEFKSFLINLEKYKNNYKYLESSMFDTPDQVKIYNEILK